MPALGSEGTRTLYTIRRDRNERVEQGRKEVEK